MIQNAHYSIRVVLFAMGLVLVAGCGKPESKPGPGNPKVSDSGAAKNPEIKTTAEELAKEVLADQKAAGTKYDGKVVELQGKVDTANQVVTDNKGFYLTGAKKKPTDVVGLNVLCMPVAGEKDKVGWLGKGQKVKVVGKVTGVNAFAVSLAQCTFTEEDKSTTPKVTVEELTSEFAKDAEAAKKKYKIENLNSQEIILEGTVADKEKKGDFHTVKLAGTDGLTVSCTVSKQNWEELKKGDKVTIKGDLSGYYAADKKVNVNTAFVLKKG